MYVWNRTDGQPDLRSDCMSVTCISQVLKFRVMLNLYTPLVCCSFFVPLQTHCVTETKNTHIVCVRVGCLFASQQRGGCAGKGGKEREEKRYKARRRGVRSPRSSVLI